MTDANNNEEPTKATTKSKVWEIVGYSLLGLVWSAMCFFIWIRAIFAGNWHWSEEELLERDPAAVFLRYAMPIIWIVVLVAAAIVIYVVKRKIRKNETRGGNHGEKTK